MHQSLFTERIFLNFCGWMYLQYRFFALSRVFTFALSILIISREVHIRGDADVPWIGRRGEPTLWSFTGARGLLQCREGQTGGQANPWTRFAGRSIQVIRMNKDIWRKV